MIQFRKADLAFYTGFQQYRQGYHKKIVWHIIQLVGLIIFLPIDINVLQTGHLMVPAIAVAITLSIVCTILLIIKYYLLFLKYGLLLGFVQLARDTLHCTQQNITDASSQESCTSKTVLHQETGVLIEGANEKTIEVLGNAAKFQIDRAYDCRFSCHEWLSRIQYFSGTTGMIVAIALLIASNHLNKAEGVVFTLYTHIEAYCRWVFVLIAFLIAVLIALSPIILLGFCFWICCCGPDEDNQVLDVPPKKATVYDIVLCDGECAICLMSVDPENQIYKLPCSVNHIFHTRCLDKWAKVRLICPSCGKDLPFKNVVANADDGIEIQSDL